MHNISNLRQQSAGEGGEQEEDIGVAGGGGGMSVMGELTPTVSSF
jgi:hypothetical protein